MNLPITFFTYHPPLAAHVHILYTELSSPNTQASANSFMGNVAACIANYLFPMWLNSCTNRPVSMDHRTSRPRPLSADLCLPPVSLLVRRPITLRFLYIMKAVHTSHIYAPRARSFTQAGIFASSREIAPSRCRETIPAGMEFKIIRHVCML